MSENLSFKGKDIIPNADNLFNKAFTTFSTVFGLAAGEIDEETIKEIIEGSVAEGYSLEVAIKDCFELVLTSRGFEQSRFNSYDLPEQVYAIYTNEQNYKLVASEFQKYIDKSKTV